MNTPSPIRSTLLQTPSITRTSTASSSARVPALHPLARTQLRHATLIKRPLRPYAFTQLVMLSDGSTYTHRTTSPAAVLISTKDTRNSPLWNPSSQKLLNVEADEAGKLRRFREKFGRGWDAAEQSKDLKQVQEGKGRDGEDAEAQSTEAKSEDEGDDNLLDLISGYGRDSEVKGESVRTKTPNEKKRKG